MEQGLNKSGLNLNPMELWKYVMAGREDRLPCILIKGETPEGVRNLIISTEEFPIDWIVEDGPEIPDAKNVLYREKNRLTDKEWYRSLSNVDYLICIDGDTEYCLQAALCGVKVITDEEELEGQSIKVIPKYDRIENWEIAKKSLT